MPRKRKISYSRDEGLEHLPDVSSTDQEGSSLVIDDSQLLTIGFLMQGARAPRDEDLAAFNAAVPICSLANDASELEYGMIGLRLTIHAPKKPLSAESESTRASEEAAQLCLALALKLLASLGLATNTIVIWQGISAAPFLVIPHGSGMSGNVVLPENYTTFANPIELHAGHLLMALDVFSHLQVRRWPTRFYELYHKGMMLFHAPEVQSLNFREETYQSFYKCLEYITMGQVLKKRGEYSSKALAQAFKKLGIQPRDSDDHFGSVVKSGNELSRIRGSKVSHFVLGHESTELGLEEIFELKGIVDFMVRAYVANSL